MKQKKNESACYACAVQQTGVDPARQQPVTKPATTAAG